MYLETVAPLQPDNETLSRGSFCAFLEGTPQLSHSQKLMYSLQYDMAGQLGLQDQGGSILLGIPSLLGVNTVLLGPSALGLRLRVFVPVPVGVVARLALQQQELAVVGQRHVLHQLGQSFWVLAGGTHSTCFNPSSRRPTRLQYRSEFRYSHLWT